MNIPSTFNKFNYFNKSSLDKSYSLSNIHQHLSYTFRDIYGLCIYSNEVNLFLYIVNFSHTETAEEKLINTTSASINTIYIYQYTIIEEKSLILFTTIDDKFIISNEVNKTTMKEDITLKNIIITNLSINDLYFQKKQVFNHYINIKNLQKNHIPYLKNGLTLLIINETIISLLGTSKKFLLFNELFYTKHFFPMYENEYITFQCNDKKTNSVYNFKIYNGMTFDEIYRLFTNTTNTIITSNDNDSHNDNDNDNNNNNNNNNNNTTTFKNNFIETFYISTILYRNK